MWRAATQEVLFALPLQEAEAIGFVDDEWQWFPLTVQVCSLPPVHVLMKQELERCLTGFCHACAFLPAA